MYISRGWTIIETLAYLLLGYIALMTSRNHIYFYRDNIIRVGSAIPVGIRTHVAFQPSEPEGRLVIQHGHFLLGVSLWAVTSGAENYVPSQFTLRSPPGV